MSRSAGPGSPINFMCPKERSQRYSGISWRAFQKHKVRVTGRERPYKPTKFTCIGLRSTFISREYQCSCGHVGWSNHADLERDGA